MLPFSTPASKAQSIGSLVQLGGILFGSKKKSKNKIVGKNFQKVETTPNSTSRQVSSSQSAGKTVTLTTTGDGASIDEATKVALRSAIAQAYGVFVSANTTLLNDSLVKDEIATITSGNILGYDVVSQMDLPNGRKEVVVRAVVSIGNLVNFAKSRGSTAEFAGGTFVQNIKIRKLNAANEKKVLNDLLQWAKSVAPYCYTPELQVNEPTVNYHPDNWIDRYSLDSYYGYNQNKTAKMAMRNRLKQWENQKDVYGMTFTIHYKKNGTLEAVFQKIDKTLRDISLSQDEYIEYLKTKMPVFTSFDNSWRLRSSKEDMEKWLNNIKAALSVDFTHFSVNDNTGQTSVVYCAEAADPYRGNEPTIENYNHLIIASVYDGYFFEGSGIFKPFVFMKVDDDNDYGKIVVLKFPITEEELSKYSSFTVVKD